MTKKLPKILLINYSLQDATRIGNELGIDVHRGYLANSGTYSVNHLGVSTSVINFYIPESFAEYKAVFISSTTTDKVTEEFKSKVTGNYKEDGKEFLTDYWLNNRGYLVIFTGKDLVNLASLGVPLEAHQAQQTDKTARLGININKNNPLRVSLNEQLKNIKMPATHYISAGGDKEIKVDLDSGHLDRPYTNSSSKAIGVYIDSKRDENGYGWEDNPQVMVLPEFKSLSNITITLSRTFSTLNPEFLPLSNTDWMNHDDLYPKSVATYQEEINETKRVALQKVQDLEKSKSDEAKKLSSFVGILTQTGDDLVDSVKWMLSNILGLQVIDVDAEAGKGNKKEDLLITMNDDSKILAEVKGTKAEYPSPKYIGQATNHFIRKAKLGATKCVLIVNHDYETDPKLRNTAFTGDDAELLESVEYVAYLDTRVLHKVCLAVTDGHLSQDEAVSLITGDGRIEF